MTGPSTSYPPNWPLSPTTLSKSPWELFSRMWTATMGYPPTDFRFIPGSTPLSTAKETTVAITLYYMMIFYGRKTMKDRPAFELARPFLLHNLFLSVLSAFLLLLFVDELGPGLWKHGTWYSICGDGGWTDRLVVLYYVCHSLWYCAVPFRLPKSQRLTNLQVNYLTKYFELIDTLFLVLKKKPMSKSKSLWAIIAYMNFYLLTPSIPPLLPPRRHSPPLLHATQRPKLHLLGPHHPQPHRPCPHVLVLLSKLARDSRLVERMDHSVTDSSVPHWPWYHLPPSLLHLSIQLPTNDLCSIHLLRVLQHSRQPLRTLAATRRHLLRKRLRSVNGLLDSNVLSCTLCLVLSHHVPRLWQIKKDERGGKGYDGCEEAICTYLKPAGIGVRWL